VLGCAQTRIAEAQAQPDLEQARKLILQGRGAEAWKLLEPFEFALAGREDYDYLLGVAAIEAGHPDRATLALERVLAMNPNHAAARLDMGRAHFALGDYDRARVELEDLLGHDPPPAARDTIERYLAAIDRRRPDGGIRATGYLEASAGHDSNINAGVSQNALFLPLFGATFVLAPNAVKQKDEFFALAGGVELAVPVRRSLSLIAGLDLRQRGYDSLDVFDYRSAEVKAGVQVLGRRDVVRATLGTNQYELDYESYRRLHAANLEWRRQLDRHTQISLYGQALQIRYLQPATRAQSSDMVLAGAGATRTLDEATRTYVSGNLFLGFDDATDQRLDGDRGLYGLRAAVQTGLRPTLDGYVVLGVQRSDYETENPVFATTRSDTQYDVALGLHWRFARDWSLRPQVTYTKNDATTAINEYDRYEASLALRRDWR
jgi:tetratricopeptide (TPR) repeat protein